MQVFTPLQKFITSIDIHSISPERKQILQVLIEYIQEKRNKNQNIRLNFICSHNSRRSHFAQIWAQTLSYYFEIHNITCYSGGTEATALYPLVAEILKEVGFEIHTLSGGDNPIYCIKYSENEAPVIGFSKTIEDNFNPQSDFCAVMTCDAADEACPIVSGADARIVITYSDPKAFDDTLQKVEKYYEKNLQIATELYYIFSQIQF